MNNYHIKGRLSAMLCEDFRESLSGMKVRVYSVQGFCVAPDLNALDPLSEECVQQKTVRLLAEGVTDSEGYFSLDVAASVYPGGGLEIDLVCKGARGQALQVTIDRLNPLWRAGGEGPVLAWSLCLPRRGWRRLCGHRGERVLCGRVIDQSTGMPMAGLRVRLLGLDWERREPLAEALTDHRGNFIVRPLPRETLSAERPGQADLYFRVESAEGGELLYVERPLWQDSVPADGLRVADCLRVDLFVRRDERLREVAQRVVSFFQMPPPQARVRTSSFGTAGLLLGGA